MREQLNNEAWTAQDTDTGWVPTPYEVVESMLKLAKVKNGDVLYDLGSGDGRIVITAARKLGAKAVGYEIDPELVRDSRANARKAGVQDRVTIKRVNIFTVNLRPANVVTLFLLSIMNERLIPQLMRLKMGARIVSHNFTLGGFKPERVVEVKCEDKRYRSIYLWVTPLKEE